MWLGDFDVLGPPVHNGRQEQPWSPLVADRFFFPHPLYRQGVLLTTPPKTALQLRGDTAVSFPIRAGQEVKPRVVVLTNIPNGPDDEESLVRFLVYANGFDVEGLITTTSTHRSVRIAREFQFFRIPGMRADVGRRAALAS